MAADWRGWRLIVVNDERFRWQKQWCGDVRIRHQLRPWRLLIIRDGFADAVPGVVSSWIESARSRGWPYDVPNLEFSAADFGRLPVTGPMSQENGS
jgi:hypothetical protein